MHRWSTLIIGQRNATQSSLFIILQVHSTCFGCQPHPSSGVHKIVTTASRTGHIFCAATSLERWREVAAQKIWPVPEAVVQILCTPDVECGWHPKHVEWSCRTKNRLLCGASLWTISNIYIYIYTHNSCAHWILCNIVQSLYVEGNTEVTEPSVSLHKFLKMRTVLQRHMLINLRKDK